MSSIGQSRARAVADVDSGTILATVDIAAPRERVFRALASRDIVEWWGQDGVYRTTDWKGDVRVGGKWRADGIGADGKAFAVEGEYVEIDAPNKLVHTWRPDWVAGETTTVSYLLEAIDGGTRVTLRHTGFTSAESCRGHAHWSDVLDWLGGWLAKRAPHSFFFLRLVPPRPTFAMDMNEAERAAMMEHVGYWTNLLNQGVAVAFGPVGDPNGPWGLGLVEVESAERMKALEAGDPAIKAGIGMRYEVLPMLRAVVRPFG